MSLHVIYFFFSSLVFLFFNCNLFVLDEELLVGFCLLLIYALLFQTLRRFLRFVFFHKVDFVFFYFYFLLKLLEVLYEGLDSLVDFFAEQWSKVSQLDFIFIWSFGLLGHLSNLWEYLGLEFFFSGFFFNYYLQYVCLCLRSLGDLFYRQQLSLPVGEWPLCEDAWVEDSLEEPLPCHGLALLSGLMAPCL